MHRPLWLNEILQHFLAEPLEIEWRASADDKKLCVCIRRFTQAGTEYKPSSNPHRQEILSFDSGLAKTLLKQGVIELKSAKVDIGEANFRGEPLPAYRPWPGTLPGSEPAASEFHRVDDPFVAIQLKKFIQVFPRNDLDLIRGDRFITTISVIRLVSHRVEGLPDNPGAAVEILQP